MRKSILLLTLTAATALTAAAWASQKPEGNYPQMKEHGKHMFKTMDTNDDGLISIAEHEEALTRSTERRRERFTKMDTNGDGSLSQEEAREARKKMKGKHREWKDDRSRDSE